MPNIIIVGAETSGAICALEAAKLIPENQVIVVGNEVTGKTYSVADSEYLKTFELQNHILDTSKLLADASKPNTTKAQRALLKPCSPKPTQNRNEICSCGSGLKYKKCCGKTT